MFELQKAQRTILFVYLLFSTVGTFGQTPIEEDDKAAITAVSKARAEAFNNGDAEGIAVHFTENAILMAPEKPALMGQRAIADYYQSIFDEFEVVLESHYEEVKVSGDMAIGRGEATVKLRPKGSNKPMTSSSKYLNVLRRQPDGSWKTTHDVWNGNEVSTKP